MGLLHSRRRADRLRQPRIAAALSAAAARRRLRSRRGGGVSVHAADDRLPGPGGRRRGIAVVMPPTPTGAYNPDLLAVCHELGVTEVYRIGGAQAVAALAYGVEGITAGGHDRRPGQHVRHAGQEARLRPGGHRLPRRAERGRRGRRRLGPPEYVAADLIAQAEHSPGVSILVTWHAPLLDEVARRLEPAAEQAAARRPGPRQPGTLRGVGPGPRQATRRPS